ncbi:MAG: hypothetical protein ACLFUJ_01785 [Phycisphaerae bacterium]
MIDAIGQQDPLLTQVPAEPVEAQPSQPVEAAETQPAGPVGQPARGPMRALENLLSHAPRDLMKHGTRHIDKLMDRLGFRAQQLAEMTDADTARASVSIELSYQAVRQIDQAGNETFAMQFSLDASFSAFAEGQNGQIGAEQTFSLEGFMGAGNDPKALFEQTFNPPSTADSIVNHAVDRYRQMLENQGAEDTAENRSQYVDLVQSAVDNVAETLREKYADDAEKLDQIDRIARSVAGKLNDFLENGLGEPTSQTDPATAVQQQMWMQLEMTRTVVRTYNPAAGPEETDIDEQQPALLDVAA